MQLYPMQFGGPNFRAGTNVGLVEGMKAGAMIGLQTQFISFSGNTLKSLIKPYNSFARSTTGQFSGPNHNALRSAAYQDYKMTFIQSVDFSMRAINTTLDVYTPVQQVINLRNYDDE